MSTDRQTDGRMDNMKPVTPPPFNFFEAEGIKTFVERKFEINLNKLKQSCVLNLSNVTLSQTELDLLVTGLTFIPSPAALGEDNNDLAYMFQRMRLKLHFADDDIESESTEFEQHLITPHNVLK